MKNAVLWDVAYVRTDDSEESMASIIKGGTNERARSIVGSN
jgi:hypothetical protein